MKERPILFSAPMVRALLDGSKTQTRRIAKLPHQNPLGQWEALPWGGPDGGRLRDGSTVPAQMVIGHSRTGDIIGCPHGQPGDQLWVRETFTQGWPLGADGIVEQFDADGNEKPRKTFYRATSPDLEWCDGGDDCPIAVPWKPSIHMPRAASRTSLEITGVRIERLQDIGEADALAEGVYDGRACQCAQPLDFVRSCGNCGGRLVDAVDLYRTLWESLNGAGSWALNPWVWVVKFRRLP